MIFFDKYIFFDVKLLAIPMYAAVSHLIKVSGQANVRPSLLYNSEKFEFEIVSDHIFRLKKSSCRFLVVIWRLLVITNNSECGAGKFSCLP